MKGGLVWTGVLSLRVGAMERETERGGGGGGGGEEEEEGEEDEEGEEEDRPVPPVPLSPCSARPSCLHGFAFPVLFSVRPVVSCLCLSPVPSVVSFVSCLFVLSCALFILWSLVPSYIYLPHQ